MPPAPTAYPGDSAIRALGDARARPDAKWVERLTGASPGEVESVLRESTGFLAVEQEIRTLHRSGGRAFYAQIRSPLELYALTRLLRPHHIVETGVSSGISSAHFLLGIRANRSGALHSIDFPTPQRAAKWEEDESPVALPPGRESGWAIPASLRRRWDLRIGPSQKLLPPLVHSLDRIDLFLHDSLHTPEHLAFELEAIRPKLRPGSVVLADNTEWTGRAFDDFVDRLGARLLRRRRSGLVGLRVP